MPADSDDWWDVDRDPVEDALSDCRIGHYGAAGRVLAAEISRQAKRIAELEAELDAADEAEGGARSSAQS